MSEIAVDRHQPSSLAFEGGTLSAEIRSEIDASTRSVVLSFLLAALGWLAVSTVLGMVSALQLIFPGLLDSSLTNFGKLAPASKTAFTYGWCACAAMGVSAWILARTSASRLMGAPIGILGCGLWNLGLLLGILSLLAGQMRPLSGLEIPQSAAVVMFSGFALYLVALLASFRVVGSKLPLSSMFVLGGTCWMAWSFLSGNLLADSGRLVGVLSQVAADWTRTGVEWVWLTAVGLGSAYYVIPKVSGQPIYSGALGRGCFWLYLLVAGLTASSRLSGGPIPLWLSSVGASASILLVAPVLGTCFNLFASGGNRSALINSPSGRFTAFGLLLLMVATLVHAVSALREIHFAVQFTLFDAGIHALLVHGFVSMALFGAIYYIMPRLSACEWLSSTLISAHFLGMAYGTAMGSVSLLLSGTASGAGLDSPDLNFRQVLELGAAYYWARVLSYVLLVGGFSAFALNFLLISLRIGQPPGEPTLFRASDEH